MLKSKGTFGIILIIIFWKDNKFKSRLICRSHNEKQLEKSNQTIVQSVGALNVINDPKCIKILKVITFCPNCNKLLRMIKIGS